MKVMSRGLIRLYQSDCDMLSKRGIVMNSGDRFTTGDWFISPVLYAIERRVSEVYGKWLYESKIECIYTFADGDGGWAEARAATRIEAAMKFAEILPTQSGSERTQDEYEERDDWKALATTLHDLALEMEGKMQDVITVVDAMKAVYKEAIDE